MKSDSVALKAFKCAFPHTVPILAGFWFLGISYGMLMSSAGFSFWYPLLMTITIFGGSLEFIAVSMLLAPFAPLQTLVLSILIQARHLFYGISMLDKFKNMGWKKPYLIFGMCDETFSINYTAQIPGDVDRGWFYFWVTLLNHSYWVSGSCLGALLGGVIEINTKGLDFVLTSMFVVIFMEQWRRKPNLISALVGFVASVGCLMIFGQERYMIPTMGCILALLILLKPWVVRAGRN